MISGLLCTALFLLLAYAIERSRKITLPPIEVAPTNRRVYQPGVVVRTRQLVRAMEARRAVRGDDGYVQRTP
jgi:hypothetical protein